MRSAAIFGLLALASTAHAKSTFQGQVVTSGGWTSNANAATTTATGEPVRDFFGIISPGVVFTSALPRAVQRLGYNFSAQMYAQNPELTTYANRLDWRAAFTPTPLTDLLISVSASQAQTNTVNQLTISSDSAATPLTVTTQGRDQFFGVNVAESLGYLFRRDARFTQGLSFSAFLPIARGLGQSYTAGSSFGLERAFRKDAFGGGLNLSYVHFAEQRGPVNSGTTVDPDAVLQPARHQVLANLLGRWRRDFGHFWNVELTIGVIMVASPSFTPLFEPTGSASLRYLHPKGGGELSYSHNAAPSALVQQTFMQDSVSLRGAVPFPEKSRLTFAAGVGYSHGRSIDARTGFTGSSVDIAVVDGTLSWAPLPAIAIFTRYTFNAQLGDAGNDPPIPDFFRHAVLLGLTGVWPTTPAAIVPARLPLRVDSSDYAGIPSPHSQPRQ